MNNVTMMPGIVIVKADKRQTIVSLNTDKRTIVMNRVTGKQLDLLLKSGYTVTIR